MESEIWLGWNSQNPYNWEDGTPAYPNGFSAFTSGGARPQRPGAPASRTWPVNARNPFAPPPGSAPCVRRQNPPTQPGPGGREIPQGVGPLWDLVPVTQRRAFVCEVPAGRNNPAPANPGMGGQQPGFRGQQPGFRGQQPGFGGGGQQPGFGGGGQQPGFGGGGQQPGFGGGGQQPRQPGFGGGGQQPRQPGQGGPRFNPRPRMLQENADLA